MLGSMSVKVQEKYSIDKNNAISRKFKIQIKQISNTSKDKLIWSLINTN